MHGTCVVVPAYAGLYACSMHGCSKSIHVPCMFHAWLFQFIHVPCMFHAWLFQFVHVPCMAFQSMHITCMLFQSMHVACMLQVTMHGMCWNMHVSGAPFSVGRNQCGAKYCSTVNKNNERSDYYPQYILTCHSRNLLVIEIITSYHHKFSVNEWSHECETAGIS